MPIGNGHIIIITYISALVRLQVGLSVTEKREQAKKCSYIAYVLNIFATMVGTFAYFTLYVLYCATDLLDYGTDHHNTIPVYREG